MPLVEVTIMEGRPREKKDAMMKEVAEAVNRTLDAPMETIRVVIREVPPSHWSVGGVPKG
ncbi:MAG: 2-hydroxymuconate tautomerase family protein [Rhodospirillum sp.]|nr:2-hydroxymuconate tautomerase family protein [Rhodospirillum sp.]MCF8488200.1 2-hydroxymuconate tautomerase family protein [Rhodospirillum sp.]MCF8501371.1 2-hydroxymuconate tautomerase family protein [Rhodospirillum sp.]